MELKRSPCNAMKIQKQPFKLFVKVNFSDCKNSDGDKGIWPNCAIYFYFFQVIFCRLIGTFWLNLIGDLFPL